MCLSGDIKSLTVWFGKEITIEEVKWFVKRLKAEGYIVNAPFYIGYNITDTLVLSYLKNSVDNSDALYLIGSEGSLLEKISEYAESVGRPILRTGACVV